MKRYNIGLTCLFWFISFCFAGLYLYNFEWMIKKEVLNIAASAAIIPIITLSFIFGVKLIIDYLNKKYDIRILRFLKKRVDAHWDKQ